MSGAWAPFQYSKTHHFIDEERYTFHLSHSTLMPLPTYSSDLIYSKGFKVIF
jgi:hypothetical protein